MNPRSIFPLSGGGREFEQWFFGSAAKFDAIHLQSLIANMTSTGKHHKQPPNFEAAVIEAKRDNQRRVKWDPNNPSTPVSQLLFKILKRQLSKVLGKTTELKPYQILQVVDELRLACFVGTEADFYHNLDAALYLGNERSFDKHYFLSLTVDQNEVSTSPWISQILSPMESWRRYVKHFKDLAPEIVEVLLHGKSQG